MRALLRQRVSVRVRRAVFGAAVFCAACTAPRPEPSPSKPPPRVGLSDMEPPATLPRAPSPTPTPAPTPTPPSAEELEILAAQAACHAGNGAECFRHGELAEKWARATETSARDALMAYGSACHKGLPQGCTRAGAMFTRDDNFLWNPEQARSWFKAACDRGDAAGCTELARLDAAAAASPPTDPVVLEQLTCQGGTVTACIRVGERYQSGQGLPRAPERAAQLYRRLCSYFAEDARGCNKASQMYRSAAWSGRDLAQAARYSKLACDRYASLPRSRPPDPFDAAPLDGCRDLAAMYAAGEGVPQDAARAVQLLAESCGRLHGPSCYEYALRIRRGDGVAPDEARARNVMERACQVGEPRACAEIGAPRP